MELLIDTGASCSLLKENNFKPNTVINTYETICIEGAFNGKKKSNGTVIVPLNFGNNFIECHKFHVINNSCNIPGDGILGTDFLSNKVIIDCIENKIFCKDQKNNQLVEIANGIGKKTTSIEKNVPWTMYVIVMDLRESY